MSNINHIHDDSLNMSINIKNLAENLNFKKIDDESIQEP